MREITAFLLQIFTDAKRNEVSCEILDEQGEPLGAVYFQHGIAYFTPGHVFVGRTMQIDRLSQIVASAAEKLRGFKGRE